MISGKKRRLWPMSWPVLLALSGAGLIGLSTLVPEADSRGLHGWAEYAGRVLMVCAVGWAVALLTDWRLAAAIDRADISVADNLSARKFRTRMLVLRRVAGVLLGVITLSVALMSIPVAREVGLSLFASAGVAGIVVGIAAQPVLANLIAGLQIAITQPIRIDDAVVVEGEWGWIEEIGLFHVIIRLWDERRLVTPLTYFNQNPFQNWTKQNASIIGSIFWSLDYRAPLEEMRAHLKQCCEDHPLWDGRVCVLQVTEARQDRIELRALTSARSSPDAWDLRCDLREKMIVWLRAQAPYALPVQRLEGRFYREGDEGANRSDHDETHERTDPPDTDDAAPRSAT
ncbi:MscS mechanosensitive ion channel [Hyphomonas polymorpha PS728]|uniref:MscS mechanosensitive ion channel n=1 Tax=Hyphomonas polymorpha PS728 TaxID=1280954 RepID=A0A062VGH2_9PROT|nr:mechanosensitive ion channel domain-containing protein [Hyphomonas polymorpha]KCZ99474.1 MscS mechanosensitive ion channel [Hyphomonas polymorpha PS728]